MTHSEKAPAQVHVRLSFPNGGSLDESDVALIETIKRCRSILGTSKLIGLSYRKTWLMTDALNRTFEIEGHRHFSGPARRGRGGYGVWRTACGAVPFGGTALGEWSRRRDRRAYGFSCVGFRGASAGRGSGSS